MGDLIRHDLSMTTVTRRGKEGNCERTFVLGLSVMRLSQAIAATDASADDLLLFLRLSVASVIDRPPQQDRPSRPFQSLFCITANNTHPCSPCYSSTPPKVLTLVNLLETIWLFKHSVVRALTSAACCARTPPAHYC